MPATAVSVPVEDVRAIEAFLYRAVELTDSGKADRLPETLAPHGRVLGLGPDPLNHEEFTTWAIARAANTTRRTRHLITNIRLTPLEEAKVRSQATLLIYAIEGEGELHVSFLGDQLDVLIRDEHGRWLLEERELVPLGS